MVSSTKMDSPILHFCFNCVVFGLRPSPAILGAVIPHHLDKYSSEHPRLIEQIRSGLYVDDLITGTDSVDSTFQIYLKSKQIMKEGGLHVNFRKWNTNFQELLYMGVAFRQNSRQQHFECIRRRAILCSVLYQFI